MKNKLAILLIYCCCSFTALAQSDYGIKGVISDTSANVKLHEVTVLILNAKDSTLQKFTYTNKGLFNIGHLKPGKFILLAAYPDYADYSAEFTLDATHPLKNFGNLSLTSESRLLKEVIVKGKVVPIKIKGDTTEFDAAAYATQKNAKVEDLLKQLPGMRINQSGVILFQGEAISKVLVDGEEFFGDDPALVTKNVRADMVKKVQVYNQQSEQAKLTGVEDGVKVKTINIQLREDKKRGVFGKTEADEGTDKYYADQAMFNKFSPKEKFAAYGNMGNTGNVGLSGGDNSKYGSDSFGSNGYNGVGIPLARDGGVHYDNKWNKDKQTINSNFKISSFDDDGISNKIIQNNLPGNFNKSTQKNTFYSHNFQQNADAVFSSRLDSTSDLRLQINTKNSTGNSTDNNLTVTLRGNGILLNDNSLNNGSSYHNQSLTANARYIKRLKKAGRSISVYSSTSFSKFVINAYLKSKLHYYNDQGVQDSISQVDQYKPTRTNNTGFTLGASYTEPLSKFLSLSLSNYFFQGNSNSKKVSFNKSTSNQYDLPDPIYSSNFRTENVSNTYNVSLYYHKGKTSLGMGTSIANSRLKQVDLFADTALTRNFVDWTPNAYFYYQMTKAASLSFNYYGYTSQPSINQIQPLKQNTDPLNVFIGNPGLRPEFHNTVSANYRLYQATSDQGINLRASYSNVFNAIVNNRATDSAGVNTYQASNLHGRQQNNWSAYLEFYWHLTKADFLLSPSLNINGSTYFNYINHQLNETRSINYNPGISINKNKTTYSYYFDIGANLVVNSTSLQKINNNSRGYFSHLNLYTKLPLNFFIGTNGSFEHTDKNQVFANPYNKVLLKAYFGKTFLKEENLKFSLTGNDLLNQNTGYIRTGNTDSFVEQRNTTIRRYFMLSVTWDFSKFHKTIQP